MAGREPGRRILVVEDDEDTRRMIRTILRQLGTDLELLEATDGHQAWARLRAEPVDLVISDVTMPRMDGLSLVRRMKASASLAGVPVIFVTARTGPKDVIAGINAGARHFLTKPFRPDELLTKVRRALPKKG
ncbi:MAG TPA: response regulator [Sandaracinaceae bacterium LLY-WYZ-13_1]|nr:response regulator [Sandaracinaceae bacterium LLY-WYZ-13_1]